MLPWTLPAAGEGAERVARGGGEEQVEVLRQRQGQRARAGRRPRLQARPRQGRTDRLTHARAVSVMFKTIYRVSHLVASLGRVDLDLGCSITLLGQKAVGIYSSGLSAQGTYEIFVNVR